MTIYINGVATTGDMTKAVYDPDLDGLIALAQMVAAVCSETEAAALIAAAAPFVKAETRAMNAASGDVAYTGYGFTPRGLIILGLYTAGPTRGSIGFSNPALEEWCYWDSTTLRGFEIMMCKIPQVNDSSKEQQAVVKTYDGDGFTLTWTKVGLGDPVAANLVVFAFA